MNKVTSENLSIKEQKQQAYKLAACYQIILDSSKRRIEIGKTTFDPAYIDEKPEQTEENVSTKKLNAT